MRSVEFLKILNAQVFPSVDLFSSLMIRLISRCQCKDSSGMRHNFHTWFGQHRALPLTPLTIFWVCWRRLYIVFCFSHHQYESLVKNILMQFWMEINVTLHELVKQCHSKCPLSYVFSSRLYMRQEFRTSHIFTPVFNDNTLTSCSRFITFVPQLLWKIFRTSWFFIFILWKLQVFTESRFLVLIRCETVGWCLGAGHAHKYMK